jgi:hypothetical protein
MKSVLLSFPGAFPAGSCALLPACTAVSGPYTSPKDFLIIDVRFRFARIYNYNLAGRVMFYQWSSQLEFLRFRVLNLTVMSDQHRMSIDFISFFIFV